jgi:hypothetical protein
MRLNDDSFWFMDGGCALNCDRYQVIGYHVRYVRLQLLFIVLVTYERLG